MQILNMKDINPLIAIVNFWHCSQNSLLDIWGNFHKILMATLNNFDKIKHLASCSTLLDQRGISFR